MFGVDQGGIEQVRWSNFRPAPTATMLRLGHPATAAGDMTIADDVANLAQTAITQIVVDGETIALNSSDYNVATNPGNLWHTNAAGDSTVTGDNDGVREKLKIMANAINANTNLAHKAEVWGYHLAILPKDGTINKQVSAATSESDFDNGLTENVRQYSLGTAGSGSFSANGADGDDGDAPEFSEYTGSESAQTGFHALDSVDLFNLMILPEDEEVNESAMLSLWGPASTYCASRRAFLLVDPPASWTDNSTGRPEVVGDTSLINDLRASIVKDYSAVFYPRIIYSDRGLSKSIPPSGAIAGLMSRTDATRGVWKAPAGIEAGLRNILGLNVALTDAENGVLNKKGANCIRVFPNGIINWGSRTLDGDDDFGSEWKYIPVRRLALNIEESLYRGTRWVVFEPNDEPLWAKIRLNIGAYMMSLFRQGAFQGTGPKEAFFVKCDKETTTQDDINKGIVNIQVGFAPLKPAEFVVISIQQMAGEL
ncbi:MAG: phage tail sheath family protein [Desulfobulbaceae bacterium]|nr:phage tail sheath family protein [Desulfobulbaceae bacterium]